MAQSKYQSKTVREVTSPSAAHLFFSNSEYHFLNSIVWHQHYCKHSYEKTISPLCQQNIISFCVPGQILPTLHVSPRHD
jgi:hypothetical protein